MRMELLLETPLEIEVRSEETRPAKPEKKRKRRRVHIRTKERCPRCKRPFKRSKHFGLVCIRCKTRPSKFYVDLSWKGKRIRIYSFKNGQSLSS